jgi:hypothetical protein
MRKEDIKIFIDGIENPAEPNQALIDAAERYIAGDNYNRYYDDFIEGAKWQQERSYSEEDVKNAFLDGWQLRDGDLPFPKAKNKWFEQFKKK